MWIIFVIQTIRIIILILCSNMLFFYFRGIPYVSKNRVNRMNAIADKIISEDYDIVCLQEIWSCNDFRLIRGKIQEKLPHSHYFFR